MCSGTQARGGWVFAISVGIAGWSGVGEAQPREGVELPGLDPCRAVTAGAPAPAEALRLAVEATGSQAEGLLTFSSVERQVQDYQSDRAYPPYFAAYFVQETTYDPPTATEHRGSRIVYPGLGPGQAARSAISGSSAFTASDGRWLPAPFLMESASRTRNLNAWAVLADWSTSRTPVATRGECLYRDEWRPVLEREGAYGPERLYLDRDSRFPVKLERTVPHVTWGQLREEYLWSTWIATGEGRFFPSASFRLADGRVVTERTVGAFSVAAPSEVELAVLPEAEAMAPDYWLEQFTDVGPDTLRVADNVILLTHRMYNGALVAVGDTVYVMDATLSEARARQDSAWVARLFPDHRAVKVVVTDVAWPHVGGVRFWVARGATLVAHGVSEPFLRELIERRWTLRPDALERAREHVELNLTTVGPEGLSLADGAVQLFPVGGIGGEGAVVAWMPDASFLWAGDYVQNVEEATLYATEVIRAIRREGVHPSSVAAQHVPLTDWRTVVEANRTAEAASSGDRPIARLNGGHLKGHGPAR
jgi:hypothetical protein